MSNADLLIIRPDGRLECVYSDALRPVLTRLGLVRIRRASHVEPCEEQGRIGWLADLSPMNGPNLGPFKTRTAAIRAELAWLRRHL